MHFLQTVFISLIIVASVAVNAAEISLDSGLKIKSTYNDNVTMSADNKTDSVITSVNPEVLFHIKEVDQIVDMKADLNVNRYQGHPELNSEEGGLDLSWAKFNERSALKLMLTYDRISSLNENLDISGVVDDLVIKETSSVSPTVSYRLTENTSMEFSVAISETDYTEPGLEGNDLFKVVNLLNYRIHNYSIALSNKVTEKDTAIFSLSTMDYEGESNGLQYLGPFILFTTPVGELASERRLDFKYDLAKLKYIHEFTPTEKLSMSYGISNQDVEDMTRTNVYHPTTLDLLGEGDWLLSESSESANTVDLKFSSDGDSSSVSFSYNRSRTQSIEDLGGIVEKDLYLIEYGKRFSERLSFNLKARRLENKDKTGTAFEIAKNDRIRNIVSTEVKWKLTPDSVLGVSYRRLQQEFAGISDKSSSNLFYLNLSLAWPKLLSTY